MQLSNSIEISKPASTVWAEVTDKANSENYLSSVLNIEVLNQPENGFIGFKWIETRDFMGKEASETMWITESRVDEYFVSRAESNGSIYTSRVDLEESNGTTKLTMSFLAEPQTLLAKTLTFLFKPMIVKSLRQEMAKDLKEIKGFVEKI